jgi:isocitrate/isopropylmalate dehydrogenase
MMLDFLGATEAAERIEAVCRELADERGTTTEIGDAVAAKL